MCSLAIECRTLSHLGGLHASNEVLLQVCLLLVQLLQHRKLAPEQVCARCNAAQQQGRAKGHTQQCSVCALHVEVHATCAARESLTCNTT